MNELKYQIVQFLFLVLLGLGAYWALTQLDSGVTYTRDTIVEQPSTIELSPSENISSGEEFPTEPVNPETPEEQPSETPGTALNELITDLQEMVDANVILQSGSRGDRVGIVQTFLDWYFDERTVSIDNDYGPGTERLVREFQTAELNGGDGRVGPNTMRKMIELLQN